VPDEVCYIDWHVHPFRADRWLEAWRPNAERAMTFGARTWELTRSTEDPLLFRQTSIWSDRADFERYWYSDEISAAREEILALYNKPLLPVWHSLIARAQSE
jgi:quinol monooxygenase YgiN